MKKYFPILLYLLLLSSCETDSPLESTIPGEKGLPILITNPNPALTRYSTKITGSVTELYTILNKKVSPEEVNAAMKAASNESFGYTEDEIVSSDVVGISYGSLFDATQTKVMTMGDKQMVKTVSWYDNEMSYVSQLVRTVKHFAGLISK